MSEPTRAELPIALSIVIPNWNNATLLAECLESIEQHGQNVGLEVVIFDNGSTDQSLAVAQKYSEQLPIKLLQSRTNTGFATACNHGLAACGESRYLLLLNNDARFVDDIATGVSYLDQHPKVAVAQGPLLMSDGLHIDSVGSMLAPSGFLAHLHIGEIVAGSLPEEQEVFSVKGAAMWLRRSALQGDRLFDEDAFAYFEESDLCWRLWLRGWSVRYTPFIPGVVHQVGASSKRLELSLVQFHSFKNRLRSVLRCTQRDRLAGALLAHLLVCAVAAGAFALTGKLRCALSVARAIMWNLRHLARTLDERRAIQCSRRISDSELLARVGTELSLHRLHQQQRLGNLAELASRSELQ